MKAFLKRKGSGPVFTVFFLVLCMVFPVTVRAYESVDTNKRAMLTLNHSAEGRPIGGVEFKIYRVADMTSAAEFYTVSEFKNAKVSMSAETTEESWSERAITLEAYLIQRESEGAPVLPTSSGVTDENGQLIFSNLETGLYLVVGKAKMVDKKEYTPLATLISLPYWLKDDHWNYSPSVFTKNSKETRENSRMNLSVIKVWKDKGHEYQRPSEVTVVLYGNGEEYEVVKLNKQNSWKYSWDNLDMNISWRLVEKTIPENYTVTVVREENAFIVTNTFDEDTPGKPVKPPSDQPRLPQTGQLWWPVSYMSVFGLLFLLLGVKIKRKGNNKYESK